MKLRTIALTTSALVAVASLAAPASAANAYMGKVNLGFGYAWEDWSDGGESSEDYSLNYTSMHGSASVNVPYNDTVNLQFDIFGNESLDEAFSENRDGSFYGGFGAGAHLNYRDEVGALGVFAAVARAAVGGTSSSDAAVYAAGIEGEYYCNSWTLRAQVGYLDSDTTISGLVKDAGYIRAGASYYPSSRLKLTGDLGYLDGQTQHTDTYYSIASDFNEWNWGFTVEYLFGKTVPVSTYVQYKGQNATYLRDPENEADRHELQAGIRFYFGGDSDLQKSDRQGAGFESPDLITWPRFEPGKSR